MAPIHSDYYTLPFRVNLMRINGVKLKKLWIEFPWAQVKPRKKGEDRLILPSTSFFICTTKDVSYALGKVMLTISKLNLNGFLWF